MGDRDVGVDDREHGVRDRDPGCGGQIRWC